MIYGYARVSTDKQQALMQRVALVRAGCERIIEEQVSGKRPLRPKLKALLAILKPGDTLVLWSVDRLGRDALDLIVMAVDLRRKGVEIRVLSSEADHTSDTGWIRFIREAADAEEEHYRISRRTREGMQALKLRGRSFGRPRKMSESQVEQAKGLQKTASLSIRDIASKMSLKPSTVHRYIGREVGR